MNAKTGSKPGLGIYLCLRCGKLLRLDQKNDRLPPCPKCYYTVYRKIN
ncbi:MAG: hypothetical protein ABIJ45_11120 [Candidatus Zixiibacteriota bacterium]